MIGFNLKKSNLEFSCEKHLLKPTLALKELTGR